MNVSVQRTSEFQAVIVVEYDDGRMYPLVDENAPKCLLPVSNRKLLAFQLDMVAKSGVGEVYIVAPSDYQVALSHFLSEYVIRESMTIERIFVEKDKFDSCDALRAVSERIRGDFICISSDVFSRFSLGELANFHRIRSSDLTMILVAAPLDEPEKKGGKRKLRVEEEDQEYIGLCGDGRVVMKLPVTDAEVAVEITKPLLHQCGSLALRSDLLDMGIYIMSRWVLEFVVENKHLSNLKTEVLPHVIERQYQPVSYLLEEFPSLQHRKRCLSSLEPWLASVSSYSLRADCMQHELIDCLGRDLLEANSVDTVNFGGILPPPSSSPRNNSSLASLNNSIAFDRTDSLQSSTSDLQGGALMRMPSLNVGTGSTPFRRGPRVKDNQLAAPDLVRCYAFVVDGPGSTGASWGPLPRPDGDTTEPLLLQRVTNIQSYMTLSREITAHTHTEATPWPRIKGFRKKEQSVVGENTVIGAVDTGAKGGADAQAAGASGGAASGAGGAASSSAASSVGATASSAATSAAAAAGAAAGGESTVTLKASTIGHGVSIGPRSKINNCILMDGVVIGDNVTLQNSVVGAGAVIEAKSNLNEVHVGSGVRVTAGKYQKEALA